MTDANGNKADFTLEHDGNVVRAKDGDGEIFAQQILDDNGEIVAQVAVK